MHSVHGAYDPVLHEVAERFAEFIQNEREVGGSIAIWRGEQCLMNIWGGYSDSAKTRPWEENTIANIFSSTKPITALATLICHDRGLLSVHEPVAKYWPEFASNGKENILVRHIMSHTSGVAGWEEPITTSQVYDVAYATRKLAEQAPWWQPGTASGYHGQNYGQLLGEIIRRVSGKSLTDFVQTEVAQTLNADVQIGASRGDWPRVAEMIPPVPKSIDVALQLEPGTLPYKVLANPPVLASNANTEEWRLAEMGAINGHSNAQGLAKALHVISNGGLTCEGQPFLNKQTVETIFEVQADNTDLVIGMPIRIGIGFGLNDTFASRQAVPFMPSGKVVFWGGYGGSICIMDTENNITFTYVMNKMGNGTFGNDQTAEYVVLAYRAMKAAGMVKQEISTDARAV